ncbi:MAG: rbn [Crocinitomicaceae bacterium]|jgi:membrane protein|nr:rbn [Crocinitomicaceae bacterium]
MGMRKYIRFNKTGLLLKRTFNKWYGRDPFRESAIIAYYAIFSLPGLLMLIISVGGYFLEPEAVSGRLHQEISSVMGKDTADLAEEMVIQVSKTRESWLATIIGIATILIGATGVFAQIQKSLNTIWEVKATTAKSGIWIYLKTRLFSLGLILSIAFLLLISLVISAALSAVSTWLESRWSMPLLLVFQGLNFLLSLVFITLLFALMFKMLPDAQIKIRYVWVGAFLTSLLFVLGKTALGFYFGKADPGSGYGAAGSVILILLWVSYSSMIVFFGAEFTKVYADYYAGEVPPSETAVKDKDAKLKVG